MRVVRRILRFSNAFYFLTAGTAAACAATASLDLAGRVLVLVSPVLIVLAHELGHAGFARASGRRVTRMVVTPFWGCTTIVGPRHTVRWLLTILAGPVAGAVVAAAYLVVQSMTGAVGAELAAALRFVAIVSILESAGNLLPFGALDGRKVYDMIRVRRRLARVVIQPTAQPEPSPEGVDWALGYLTREMEPQPDRLSGVVD